MAAQLMPTPARWILRYQPLSKRFVVVKVKPHKTLPNSVEAIGEPIDVTEDMKHYIRLCGGDPKKVEEE